jgi:hypothetical protein
LGVALALLAPLCAAAQEPRPTSVTVHGSVVAAGTDQPLAFSIVALRPGVSDHFTDQDGTFRFTDVAPGIYRLIVRQIGYSPADSIVIVRDADVTLRIKLSHLAVELPPITVVGRTTCTQPGPPDPTVAPALAAVFDQVLEHVRRFELLADSYPFRFRIERTQWWVSRADQALTITVDSIDQTSREERRTYRPGEVVEWGRGPFQGERVVRLPGLTQFGDSAFIHTHCFRLAGRDTIEGEALVRVDFVAAARLRSANVEGAAYLDAVTYQLRFTRVALTRAQRALPGVVALVATTRFREIAPGIVLHDHVRAVTTLPPPPRPSLPAQRIEEQRLLGVEFLRPLYRAP